LRGTEAAGAPVFGRLIRKKALLPGLAVEGQVQLQDVDVGFAEEAEQTLGGVIFDQAIDVGY
jgi:hypothetical protein